MHLDYEAYLDRNPRICGHEPVLKGTRVTVRTVLANLAEGLTLDEILQEYPTLDEEAVRSVISFAVR